MPIDFAPLCWTSAGSSYTGPLDYLRGYWLQNRNELLYEHIDQVVSGIDEEQNFFDQNMLYWL